MSENTEDFRCKTLIVCSVVVLVRDYFLVIEIKKGNRPLPIEEFGDKGESPSVYKRVLGKKSHNLTPKL